MTITKDNIQKFLNDNNCYLDAWRFDAKMFEQYDKNKILEVIRNNYTFINAHGLTFDDVNLYIKIQKQFEDRTQKNKKPQPADSLEVWSNNKKIFYKNAHIEKCSYNDTGWNWAESASSHYITIDSFLSSGGAWHQLDIKKLKYVGTTTKTIWTWGHSGATGNGGLYIPVKVNKFKITIDQKYIPFVVYKMHDSDFGYKYAFDKWHKKDYAPHCYKSCFKSMQELKDFLRQRRLKIGKKLSGGCCHEVVGDFEYIQYMDKKLYDAERKNRKEFRLLSNGQLTGAFYKNKAVHFCNCNVKDRTIFE